MDLRTGDIVFFRTEFCSYKPLSWLGWIIRIIAKVDYNHVGVIVNNWGEPFINEAVGRGIISTPAAIRLKGKTIMVGRASGISEKVFAIEANAYLGHTKYDLLGLLWHQLVYNILGKWKAKQSEQEAKKKFYCYEYAAFLHRGNYPNWWKVRPKDFEGARWLAEVYKNFKR